MSGRVAGVQTCVFFFFNDTATTEIYTLSLHDALPISQREMGILKSEGAAATRNGQYKKRGAAATRDWVLESEGDAATRNRSEEHTSELQSPVPISYAVFCLKKKK